MCIPAAVERPSGPAGWGADPGQVANDVDAMPVQIVGRTDAGQHQQLGRIGRAPGDNDFFTGFDPMQFPGLQNFDTPGAIAVEQDPGDVATGQDSQVGALSNRGRDSRSRCCCGDLYEYSGPSGRILPAGHRLVSRDSG